MENTKNRKNWLLSFFQKIITQKIILVLVVLIILLLTVWGVGSHFISTPKTTDIGLRNIGELATQVAYVTEVDVIDVL